MIIDTDYVRKFFGGHLSNDQVHFFLKSRNKMLNSFGEECTEFNEELLDDFDNLTFVLFEKEAYQQAKHDSCNQEGCVTIMVSWFALDHVPHDIGQFVLDSLINIQLPARFIRYDSLYFRKVDKTMWLLLDIICDED